MFILKKHYIPNSRKVFFLISVTADASIVLSSYNINNLNDQELTDLFIIDLKLDNNSIDAILMMNNNSLGTLVH